MVINALSQGSSCSTSYGNIVEDILFFVAAFQLFYFCHVKRICNVVVDSLVEKAKDLLGIWVWMKDLPAYTSSLVLLDVHWFVFGLLRGCLDFQYPSSIILFPSLITQNWWISRWVVCLDVFPIFVSITQFFDFWVISYGNWKQLLGVFELWKHSYNSILVNTHIWGNHNM